MCLSACERVGTAQGKRETRGDGNEGFECLFNLPFPVVVVRFPPSTRPTANPSRTTHSALVREPVAVQLTSSSRALVPVLVAVVLGHDNNSAPPLHLHRRAPCCTPDFPDCSTSGRGAGASSLKSAGCMIAVDNWTATAPSLWPPPPESQLPRGHHHRRREAREHQGPSPSSPPSASLRALVSRDEPLPLGPANRPRFLGSGRCCNTVM